MTVASAPSMVLVGGRVWTGAGQTTTAEALAVRGAVIAAVGSEAAIRRMADRDTQVVELEGRFVVPGFIDSHTHFLRGGLALTQVDLRGIDSREAFTRRIAERAASTPPGEWITGGGWDHHGWGGTLPDRGWLDAATTNHPVFLTRHDLHMGVANSRALQAAAVEAGWASPPGGHIVTDAGGMPTGVLKDRAMDAVQRAIPPATEATRDTALQRALAHAARLGVTGIHDMAGWDDVPVFRRAHAADALTLRVYLFLPIATWERVSEEVALRGRGDAWLRWGGVKGFVDGSLGSATALFVEPYADAPDSVGLAVTDTERLRAWAEGSAAADLQVAVHAIGDRANRIALDMYERIAHRQPGRAARFRVEHAQHLLEPDIARFGALGVIPSVQPYHLIDDGRWAERAIGPARARLTHAYRELTRAGARLAFGSDWTVAPLDPLWGVYAAVTRRTLGDAHPGGWFPQQKLGVEEALTAYTAGSAYAGSSEGTVGRLEPGKLADLVVLSDDLRSVAPERIPDVQVELTMVGGRIVHARNAAEASLSSAGGAALSRR